MGRSSRFALLPQVRCSRPFGVEDDLSAGRVFLGCKSANRLGYYVGSNWSVADRGFSVCVLDLSSRAATTKTHTRKRPLLVLQRYGGFWNKPMPFLLWQWQEALFALGCIMSDESKSGSGAATSETGNLSGGAPEPALQDIGLAVEESLKLNVEEWVKTARGRKIVREIIKRADARLNTRPTRVENPNSSVLIQVIQHLAVVREKAGIAQSRLAKDLGLSMWTIHRWERHGKGPSMDECERWARALGTSLKEVFGELS